MDNLVVVLSSLLAKKEIKYQDKRMNDIVIKFFAPNDVMLVTDKGYKVKAEKYTIGRKVGPKTFVPVKMDIGDFVLLPQAMTIMDIIDLRESLEKERTA